jgi:hypothetical protein
MMKTFSPEEFVTALRSSQGLQLPVPALVLTGMAQQLPSEATDAFLFSPGSSCAVWVPIPAKIVDKIDYLGKIACKSHEHDHVRVHFKAVTHPEASPFAQLLSAQTQRQPNLPVPAAEYVDLGFPAAPSAALNPSIAAFGWHPPHIPTPHWPPIHIPDPRDALRKEAERLAWATAAKIDHEKGSSTYCPREEIRAGILLSA